MAAFGLLPDLAVTFGEHWIRVHGDAAVNTGYYTFSYRKEGATKTLAERYASRS